MSASTGIRVWDLPTRAFHWLLVVLVGFSWWSAENREMEWHVVSGLTVMGLIVFRVLWGFIGGTTSRFSAFVRSPAAVIAYVRGLGGPTRPGHNPLGGYSVIALIVVLAAQVATGLFATDVDGLDSGPLSFLVSFDQGRAAAEAHEVAFSLLLALVVLHVAAIFFYLHVRRRNLLRPMVTGRDAALAGVDEPLRPAPLWRFLLAVAIAGGLAWWTSTGFGL